MRYKPEQVGEVVRQARTGMRVTQHSLAMTAGTGLRFIIDLEKGKPTCELGKVLAVLNTLGIQITLTPPKEVRLNPDGVTLGRQAGE